MTGRCDWLADALSDAGLAFDVIPGAAKRGATGLDPLGVVGHHIGIGGTANAPGLRVVTHGRPDLPGPLCNVHLARDGHPTVVATGIAKHAGKGGGRGVFAGLVGNSSVLGVEAEGTTGEPMPPAEMDGYERLAAALLDGLRRYEGVANPVLGAHHEWRAEKPDPWGLLHGPGGMEGFRYRVAHVGVAAPTEEDDMPLTDKDVERVADAVFAKVAGSLMTTEANVVYLRNTATAEMRRGLRAIGAKLGLTVDKGEVKPG